MKNQDKSPAIRTQRIIVAPPMCVGAYGKDEVVELHVNGLAPMASGLAYECIILLNTETARHVANMIRNAVTTAQRNQVTA